MDIKAVKACFIDLQGSICAALEALDGAGRFSAERFDYPEGGCGQPRVLQDGQKVGERPPFSTRTASAKPCRRRPANATRIWPAPGFQAAAISVIVHPRNPYAPTAHMNLRFFSRGWGCSRHGTSAAVST